MRITILKIFKYITSKIGYDKSAKRVYILVVERTKKFFKCICNCFQLIFSYFFSYTERDVVYSIGDSHNIMLRAVKDSRLLKQTFITTYTVSSATAMGMGNPHSNTNAYNLFRKYLRWATKKSTVLVVLGEVDCGFVIWYRRKKYSTSVSQQLHYALNRYQRFLNEVKLMGFQNIVILSAPPPTIQDGRNRGIVANLRSEIDVNLKNRTNLTLRFNSEMKNFSEDRGFTYIDLTVSLLNKDGVVAKEYLNEDVYDHHLNNKKVAPLLAKKLSSLGFS